MSKQTFKYCPEKTSYMGQLDIEDIGNCCIEAYTEECVFFYLLSETKYGSTTIFTYGPVYDRDIPLDGCTYRFSRMDFDVGKICGQISKFLAGTRKCKIMQARNITREEFLSKYINPIVFINLDSTSGENLTNDYDGDE